MCREGVVLVAVLLALVPMATGETHWQVQAVDGAGYSTYYKAGATPVAGNRIVLEGIVLNNPEDMLDMSYDAPGFMGAQWQVFVQGEGDDLAGTAVWMGQRYDRMGDFAYTAGEWAAEMQRVNYPGGHHLRMGDRVRVTGYGLGYNGKTNINERHSSSPMLDFTVEYLGQSPGLPQPERICLADVKSAGDIDIFDPMRMTGGERYQGRLVRIGGVHLVSGTWGPNQMLTVADDTGRSLPVKLGNAAVFSQPSNLGSTFDVVGIFNQEGAYTSGYQLWVMGYNGGGDLLGVFPPRPGDADGDGFVNVFDIFVIAESWNTQAGDAAYNPSADLDGDGAVNVFDIFVVAEEWDA